MAVPLTLQTFPNPSNKYVGAPDYDLCIYEKTEKHMLDSNNSTGNKVCIFDRKDLIDGPDRVSTNNIIIWPFHNDGTNMLDSGDRFTELNVELGKVRGIRTDNNEFLDLRTFGSLGEATLHNFRHHHATAPINMLNPSNRIVENFDAFEATMNFVKSFYSDSNNSNNTLYSFTKDEWEHLLNDPLYKSFVEQQNHATNKASQAVQRVNINDPRINAVAQMKDIFNQMNMGNHGVFGGFKIFGNLDAPTDLGEFLAQDDVAGLKMSDLVKGYSGFYIVSKNAYDYRIDSSGKKLNPPAGIKQYKTWKYGIFGESGSKKDTSMKNRFNDYLRDVGFKSDDNPCGGMNLHYLELFRLKNDGRSNDKGRGQYAKDCEAAFKNMVWNLLPLEAFRSMASLRAAKGEHLIENVKWMEKRMFDIKQYLDAFRDEKRKDFDRTTHKKFIQDYKGPYKQPLPLNKSLYYVLQKHLQIYDETAEVLTYLESTTVQTPPLLPIMQMAPRLDPDEQYVDNGGNVIKVINLKRKGGRSARQKQAKRRKP